MLSLYYSLFSLLILVIGRLFLKNISHPLILASSLWFFLVGISSYEPWFNNDLQTEWTITTHLVMVVGGISILLPAIMFPVVGRYNIDKIYIPNKFRYFLDLTAVLSIIAFLLRFRFGVFSPTILQTGLGVDIKELVPPGISGLHYIDLLTPIIAVAFFFEGLFSNRLSKLRLMWLIIYTLFAVVNIVLYKVSRDELTQYLAGVVFLLFVARPEQRMKFLIVVSVILVSVVVMTMSRLSENSAVFSQFSGAWGAVFSIFYTYTAFNFENVNKLVNSEFEQTYIWASLRFVLRFFYSEEYESNSLGIVMKESAFFNAKTFLYFFYHDLKIFGVFIYSFLIGVWVQFFYRFSLINSRYLLVLAISCKGLFFMFFGNFFFVDFTYFFVYPFSIFIFFLLFRKVRL